MIVASLLLIFYEGMVVLRVENQKMIDRRLKLGDLRCFKNKYSLKSHLIDPTSLVGWFAVRLKTLLDMCKQFCKQISRMAKAWLNTSMYPQ